MARNAEIVITGVGVVSPLGIGAEALLAGLLAGRSGIRHLPMYDDPSLPAPVGGEVEGFEGKDYIRPRKAMKVMSRDIQFAFAAAEMACAQAGLDDHRVDPERFGVVFGADMIPCDLDELVSPFRRCVVDGQFDFRLWGEKALPDLFPLWMLKYLPNMSACHIGIARDARGPNNTMTMGDVSSLAALGEAVRVLQRGWADAMIVGGTSSRIHPLRAFRNACRLKPDEIGDPTQLCRPFDARRRGAVNGEGAAVMIVETRQHAESRGARPLARVLGHALAFEPTANGSLPRGVAIGRAIEAAMAMAQVTAVEVGYVNAHGLSALDDDRREAQAIRRALGDVPVAAMKGNFGNLGAAGGAMELCGSVLALANGSVPPIVNYQCPDPECPVNAVRDKPIHIDKRVVVKVNHESLGQAAAVVIAAP